MEQEIIQQEKMAGVGLLATGLAHEIGNPIGIVESAVQFCLQKLNPEGSLKEHLEVIQRNISAADNTIKELLRFARPTVNHPTDVDVIELLKETSNIVATECAQKGIALNEVYPVIPAQPLPQRCKKFEFKTLSTSTSLKLHILNTNNSLKQHRTTLPIIGKI